MIFLVPAGSNSGTGTARVERNKALSKHGVVIVNYGFAICHPAGQATKESRSIVTLYMHMSIHI